MVALDLDLLRLANPWLARPADFRALVQPRLPLALVERRLPAAEHWPVPGKAHLLVGGRQTGKSTFLWKRFLDAGTPPIFLNGEEPWVRAWLSSPVQAAADLRRIAAPGVPVYVDEAQWIPEVGLALKGLVDQGTPGPLFVTGSSSYHLRSRTRESLAGRAARATMHALSLAEVGADATGLSDLVRTAELRERFGRLADTGGYPEAWTSSQPRDVVRGLVEAFVLRDASDLFRVANLDAFRRLLLLVAGQVGSLSNQAEWAAICGVSRETVASYLDILAESHVLWTAPPFVGGRRAELTGRSKVFFCDTGIRNAVVSSFGAIHIRADRGAVMENAVGAELRKHLSDLAPMDGLRYWRSKAGAEVDFVLDRPGGLLAIEVKASVMKEPKLSRSAHSFIDAYAPARFVVINLALEAASRVGTTEVRWAGPEILAQPDELGL
jgi:predicted AAA+ superfamily ATPase